MKEKQHKKILGIISLTIVILSKMIFG